MKTSSRRQVSYFYNKIEELSNEICEPILVNQIHDIQEVDIGQILNSEKTFDNFKNFEDLLDGELVKSESLKEINMDFLQNSDEKLDIIDDYLEHQVDFDMKSSQETENNFNRINDFTEYDEYYEEQLSSKDLSKESP